MNTYGELPSCTIEKDQWNGDWDCEAVHEVECEDCLCNYHNTGGLWDPESGEKVDEEEAERRYGEPQYYMNLTNIVEEEDE